MQRSKIKVGSEYAVSNRRDWWTWSVKIVQVLDTGRWLILGRFDEKGRAETPEEVQNPHMKDGFTIQVPPHIRRFSERRPGYRTAPGNLVLVRPVTTSEDGETEYGTPTLVETRHLVAERVAAEEEIAFYTAQRDEKSRKANEEREQRTARMKSINERMTALGLPAIVTGWSSVANPSVPPSTLEALLTLAEEPGEEPHCCGQ